MPSTAEKESTNSDSSNSVATSDWQRIIRSASSPLKIFALTVMVCTTIFGSAAAVLGDPVTFMYCIHMFLGLVGVFSLIALWCPAALYHPTELIGIPAEHLPKGNRIGPTVAVLVFALIYACYQYMTPARVILVPKGYSVYEISSGKFVTE